METSDFKMELAVRDYECDVQGIVNNAVYQHYLEHVRHEYLKTIGINFHEFSQKGINLVVIRVELDYKFSLTSGDRFVVTVNMQKESRIKFVFNQHIFRLPDQKLVLNGKVFGTALNARGRPFFPPEFENIFK